MPLQLDMINPFIKIAVRTLFTFTTSRRALSKALSVSDQYLELAKDISEKEGQLMITVPPMAGVDEDMRNWSFFMILEHNTIVNKSITAMVEQLAKNETLSGAAQINPKNDVMPSVEANSDQLDLFSRSISDHLQTVENLKNLRSTKTSTHPVFGDFNAHKWNCMFSFHLGLHLRQANFVIAQARKMRE